MRTYITNPNEVFLLELNKLQFCFSEVQKIGEEVSDMAKIQWRHVELLRHLNFILEEAIMTGKVLTELPH